MATYRLSVSTISRSKGRSAIAAAAYRSAERLLNERDGETHDYRRRHAGIAYAGIFAPTDAPEWAHDRAKLWNAAEAAENRKNSVTARELQLSLPHELTDEQRQELAEGYARELVTRYGVAVDLAIHRPDKKGDDRNHHAHLMLTTRRLTADGFKEKTRELDDRKTGEVERMRQSWGEHVNEALELAKVRERVDHRSYERQGIDLTPEPRLGPKAHAMLQEGAPNLKAQWREAVRKRDPKAIDRAAAAYAARQRAAKPDWYPTPPRPALRAVAPPRPLQQARRQLDTLDRLAAQLAEGQSATPPTLDPSPPTMAPGRAFQPLADRAPHAQAQHPAAAVPPATARPVIEQPQPDVFARDPAKDVWAAHYKQAKQELAKLDSTHALERVQMRERHRLAERKAIAPKADRRGKVAKLFAKLSGEEEQKKCREAKERIEAERKRAAELQAMAERQKHEREQLEAWHQTERKRIARELAETKTHEKNLARTFQRQAAQQQEQAQQRTRARGRSLAQERRVRRGNKPQDAEP